MSVVTGVILTFSTAEEDSLLSSVNTWLVENSQPALADVTEHARTRKHPQMVIAAGGFNYLNDDEFAEFVINQPWEYPENVVLVLKRETDDTRVFRATDGAIK